MFKVVPSSSRRRIGMQGVFLACYQLQCYCEIIAPALCVDNFNFVWNKSELSDPQCVCGCRITPVVKLGRKHDGWGWFRGGMGGGKDRGHGQRNRGSWAHYLCGSLFCAVAPCKAITLMMRHRFQRLGLHFAKAYRSCGE